MDFAGGLVQLVAVRAYSDGALVGRELKDLRQDLPQVDTRVAAIFRKDRPIIPRGDTVIEADDEVFFSGSQERYSGRCFGASEARETIPQDSHSGRRKYWCATCDFA